MITFAVTLTACPSMSVLWGFAKWGLPMGLQIVGPWSREDSVLSAAALFKLESGLATNLTVEPRGA